MEIERIKNSTVKQMTRIEPIENKNMENLSTEPSIKDIQPIARAWEMDHKNFNHKKDIDEGKDIQDVSAEKIKNAVSEINQRIRPTHTQCEFKYHEKTNRISITVRDSETDKVIREIPPEKTLDLIARSLELAGILVDEKR